jgi:UDP-N-acetylglucosamine:LPS N-acetylglucosamine transferase
VKPLVVAADMGYGHLRPAHAIADPLGVEVLHADRAPLADAVERRRWMGARTFHTVVSRAASLPVVGGAFAWAMGAVTHIPPLSPGEDLSAPTAAVRWLERQAAAGIGRGLVARLRESGAPLFTTFYSTAVVADRAGCEGVHCLVTDSDVNRVWVQANPARSRALYFAPSERAVERLVAYGIRPEHVRLTGYPLPTTLLGGEALAAARIRLERRLERLSGSRNGPPPLLTFAVGGAGAQTGIARRFLPALRGAVEAGRLRIALVAGVRPEVARQLRAFARRAGLEAQACIVFDEDFAGYLRRFDEVMAETDVLWTKPSEVTFFGALGIPLVLAPPVGAQEVANRAWATTLGAARDQQDPAHADEWLLEWLGDGTLARMAQDGFDRMPKHGTYRILEALETV